MGQDLVFGIIIIIVLIACFTFLQSKKSTKSKAKDSPTSDIDTNTLDVKNAYQKKWIFSYNEKDAFYKLKAISDEYGYTLLAKVRLLDLLEPQKGNPKYKTFFYKIQAKHVDFVLCDQKLVARYIIELDDSSHDSADRKERDTFVDTILEDVGYKILHTRGIQEEQIKQFIKQAPSS